MPKARILVVDDDPVIREIMEGLLCDDYDVTAAASGEEALTTAESLRPAVVLLDIVMPGIDGYEACRRLRQLDELAATKVILVSGGVPSPEYLGGPPTGADDFLLKPFDFADLFSKIEGVLPPH